MDRPFKLVAPYKPTGHQPQAIEKLSSNLNDNVKNQILIGVTGSGKTFTMANVIEKTQRPALVLAHNKTLAAQLFSEFREFFPNNSVQYFVSYYDYYQPEAYLPASDTYIEKESTINQEIEKFRHASTHSLLTRRDTIIIASVSCIYGLGSPDVYKAANLNVSINSELSRIQFLRKLTELQYDRNDYETKRGSFSVIGERIVIYPAYEDFQIRITQFGNTVEKIELLDPVSGGIIDKPETIEIYPARHYLVTKEDQSDILKEIEVDLINEVSRLKEQNKIVEAQRLDQRVRFDLEMIRETGFTSGIENYSRYFDRRPAGTPPSVLLDYFPKDFLLFIDESHISIPQIGGMYNGDQARKQNLIEYGFRLKASKDNRPLTFKEFEERIGQTIFVSATPGKYEIELIKGKNELVAEQLVRPTGVLDPEVEVRPTSGQIPNVITEIEERIKKGQRTLITTLTKRMAEDLTEYLVNKKIKVQYLHSDVETIERSNILQDLRSGIFDVVVGINLLREGLDLPEVSLIIILDADKEGFLRSESALIQTIGRAARHIEGKVIMYADKMTGSMERAINETNRRRKIQMDYNTEHNITPTSINKEIVRQLPTEKEEMKSQQKQTYQKMSRKEKIFYLDELQEKMRQAALQLNFEQAVEIRDLIKELTSDL